MCAWMSSQSNGERMSGPFDVIFSLSLPTDIEWKKLIKQN